MPPLPLRSALAGLIDYAGLFPPAGLDLAGVVERFGRYGGQPEHWMLGRLIVPLAQLPALGSFVGAFAGPAHPAWTVSVLVPADARVDTVGDLVAQFNAAHDSAQVAIVSAEYAAATPAQVERFAAAEPAWLERYVEVDLGEDMPAVLDEVASAGCYAKVRTGGVTADHFPAPAALAAFMCAAAAREVPFKATAGLHHPIRQAHRLTYAADSPTGTMHGFVNLVAAAGMLACDRKEDQATLAAVLDERDPRAFTTGPDRFAWRDVSLSPGDLALGRAHVLRSVGSCSFEDPVADLKALGWWPA